MKLSKYILVHTPDTLDAANKAIAKVAQQKSPEFTKHKPITVGLWDLGSWLGGLPRLITSLNRSQKGFVFFEAKATVPVGLISRRERLVPWLTVALGRQLDQTEAMEIKNNLIANDYFDLAEAIRKDLKIDYIIGITPSMVAGDEEDDIYWNHFSTFSRRALLISTYQLREFVKKSGYPFNAFLSGIIIAQLLVAKFYPKLGFHENRGCLFDYNEDRVSLIEKVRDPRIEPQCMKAIAPPYRPVAQSFINFLEKFK